MLMLKRESGDIAICCVEMIEDNDGDFRLGELHTFCTENWQSSANSGMDSTPNGAVLAWMRWVCSQDYEVMELPRTARTRAWGCGTMFSITPQGGESRIYTVMVEGCSDAANYLPSHTGSDSDFAVTKRFPKAKV